MEDWCVVHLIKIKRWLWIQGEVVWETAARPFEKSLISKRCTASVGRVREKRRAVLIASYISCSGCRYFYKIAGNLLRKSPRLSHGECWLTKLQHSKRG